MLANLLILAVAWLLAGLAVGGWVLLQCRVVEDWKDVAAFALMGSVVVLGWPWVLFMAWKNR